MWLEKIEKLIFLIFAVCVLSAVGMHINKEYAPLPVIVSESHDEKEMIKVEITGEVEKPGTYTVAKGSRVCDVIYGAGGITPNADIDIVDIDALVIADTEVNIPGVDDNKEIKVIPAVNINTADTDTLMLIPGIGSVTAQKIVDYRKINGSFTDIAEIKRVDGIGDKTFESIKSYIITEEINE